MKVGKTVRDAAGTIKGFYNRNKPRASVSVNRHGAEIQAGVGPVHIGAGFDTKNKSAGADLTVGRKSYSVTYKKKKK